MELYLDLPMNGFDMFDMEALPRLAEYGYEFASPALSDPATVARLRPRAGERLKSDTP